MDLRFSIIGASLATLVACTGADGGSTGGPAPNSGGQAGAAAGGAATAGSGGTAGTPSAGATSVGGSAGLGGVAGSAGADSGTPPTSRCRVTESSVECDHNVTSVQAGTAIRDVYWQTPSTPAPPGGYPAVIVYQGSFFGPAITWGTLTPSLPFGGFHQGRLQAMLLDSGFTVIAPSAAVGVAWQTNAGIPWENTTDRVFIDELLEQISNSRFGPVDSDRMFATGISSGGYMTSRMAVSYPGVFRALAIQSGSYATCLGPICVVPDVLPADHPPTLMLHGGADLTVPLSTAERYRDSMVQNGVVNDFVVDQAAGHEWLVDSPERVTAWFTANL